MIKLKNIEINNHVLSCNIIPEDSELSGNITVDAMSKNIIDFKLPKEYEWCKNHLQHAKEYLLDLYFSGENIPQEKTIMWY